MRREIDWEEAKINDICVSNGKEFEVVHFAGHMAIKSFGWHLFVDVAHQFGAKFYRETPTEMTLNANIFSVSPVDRQITLKFDEKDFIIYTIRNLMH